MTLYGIVFSSGLDRGNDKHVAVALSLLMLTSFFGLSVIANAQTCNEHCQFETEYSQKIGTMKDANDDTAFAEIDSEGSWSGSILDTGFDSATKEGSGSNTIAFACTSGGIYSLVFQKQQEGGSLTVKVVKQGNVLDEGSTTAAYGLVTLSGHC